MHKLTRSPPHVQCAAAKNAPNSGTGRYVVPPSFDSLFETDGARAVDIPAKDKSRNVKVVGQFMPDVPDSDMLRLNYKNPGYNDVCIPYTPQRSQKSHEMSYEDIAGAKCHRYTEFSLQGDTNFNSTYGMGIPTGFDDSICSTKSGTTNSDPKKPYRNNNWLGGKGYFQTNPGQLVSLRQVAASWDKCIVPGTYATTKQSLGSSNSDKMNIDPCKIAKLFNAIPQVYSNASYGWTDADFAKCAPEDVPLMVQAWYEVLHKPPLDMSDLPSLQSEVDSEVTEAEITPGQVLMWWSSMSPQFYTGSASFPAMISDYFTSKQNRCLQNVPGRNNQGPQVEDPARWAIFDPTATCSVEGACCPKGTKSSPSPGSACVEQCNTGMKQLERIYTQLTGPEGVESAEDFISSQTGLNSNGQGQLQELLNACLDQTSGFSTENFNQYTTGDPNDSKRTCVMAGQYVDKSKTSGSLYKNQNKQVHALFATKPTDCGYVDNERIKTESLTGDIVFVTTAPRLTGTPIHPIFQTAFNVGGGADQTNENYNRTDGPNQNPVPNIFNVEIPVEIPLPNRTSKGFPIQRNYPEKITSTTAGAWNGLELNMIITSNPCSAKNHRESVSFSDIKINGQLIQNQTGMVIPIPGLYPRWIDIQQGGTPQTPNVHSCLRTDSQTYPLVKSGRPANDLPISNWATHGDRFAIDLYNTGGAVGVVSQNQLDHPHFLVAHSVDFFEDNKNSFRNPPFSPFPTNGFCLVVDPNRCNGMCDMAKFEMDMAFAGTISAVFSPTLIFMSIAGDNAMTTTSASPMVTTEEIWPWGQPVMEQTSTENAALYTDIEFTGDAAHDQIQWRNLFNARLFLNTTLTGRYLFTTNADTSSDDPFEIYRKYPSMRRACHYSTEGNSKECIAGPTYEPSNTYWTGSKSYGGAGFPTDYEAKPGGSADGWQSGGPSGSSMPTAEQAATSMYTNNDYLQRSTRYQSKDYVSGKKTKNSACPVNYKNPGRGKADASAATYVSWWAGATSMLEPTQVGTHIGCMVNDKKIPEGQRENFKFQDGFTKYYPAFDENAVHRMTYTGKTNDRTMSFVTMAESELDKKLFSGIKDKAAYVALDQNKRPLNIVSGWAPRHLCGICANIGAASNVSPRRNECKIKLNNGDEEKHARYNIGEEGLGVFDEMADDFLANANFYDNSTQITKVVFTYYDSMGSSNSVVGTSSPNAKNGATQFNGESTIERLLGVNLDFSQRDTYMHGATKPACYGDVQSYEAPFCEIDENLFTHDPSESVNCKSSNQTFPSTCTNPRWANDHRISFPPPKNREPKPTPVGSRTTDFDPLAADLSYCNNGPWSFAEPDWYNGPIITDSLVARPNPADQFQPSTFANTTASQLVRCESDRMSDSARFKFCKGDASAGIPEGYVTNFGVVSGVKTTLDSVCDVTKNGAEINADCIIYANDTLVGNMNNFQRIIESFPDLPTTSITIHAVPVAARIMSKALLLFMTDVSTLYYSDASNVGTAAAYLQSSTHGILGKRMNVSWEESERMFGGMCHVKASQGYFAQLYATVERFRFNKNTFGFVDFEGLGQKKTNYTVEVTEEEVYPAQITPKITSGQRNIVLQSAFGAAVAAQATKLLNTPTRVLKQRKFKFSGMSDQLGASCTRIVLQQVRSVVSGFEFDQGGICTALATESMRVPIMGGGSRISASRITDSTCVDCPAGLFVAAGGDINLATDVTAANMDVEGLEITGTDFIWTDRTGISGNCESADRLSKCQNASFPGTEASFARIVGNPIIPACPSTAGDNNQTVLSPFCDVFFKYSGTQILDGQVPGNPIASKVRAPPQVLGIDMTEVTSKICTSTCTKNMYDDYATLFSNKPNVDECCDGKFTPTVYSCNSNTDVFNTEDRDVDPASCEPNNCFWNTFLNQTRHIPTWINQSNLDWNPTQPRFIDADLCAAFFMYCRVGACVAGTSSEDNTPEPPCAECASNQTFFWNCMNMSHPASFIGEFQNLIETGEYDPDNTAKNAMCKELVSEDPCGENNGCVWMSSYGYCLPKIPTDQKRGLRAANFLFPNTLSFQNYSRPYDIQNWFRSYSALARLPPCAETGFIRMTNGQNITQPSNENEVDFMESVIKKVINKNLDYEACSPLGCPDVIKHQSVDHFVRGIPICVNTSTDTLKRLHQTWMVLPASTGILPLLDTKISIFAPSGDVETGGRPGLDLPANSVDSKGVGYTIMDTYRDSANLLNNTIDIFTGQIGILHEDMEDPKPAEFCLSRKTDPTATGTEYGGLLESRPCSPIDAFQAWNFVYLEPVHAWRIQVPLDPFLCITVQSEQPFSTTNECNGLPEGSSCYHEPHPLEKDRDGVNLVPAIVPCFGCTVGVDTEGTGSGPVVSSVLELPAIATESIETPVDAIRIPLSTSNDTLELLVDLKTGLCYKSAPPSTLFSLDGAGNTGDKVACSLLEGAPLAQLQAIGGEDICSNAAGILVSPCIAQTGGLSFVDGEIFLFQELCTKINEDTLFSVTSATGKRAQARCVEITEGTRSSMAFWTLEVVTPGLGFRDNDVLMLKSTTGAVISTGPFYGHVKKILWQPHSSSESVASAPITSTAVEVLNISKMFDLIGGENLYAIYAGGVGSASAAYVVFGIQVVVIVSGIAYHAFTIFNKK